MYIVYGSYNDSVGQLIAGYFYNNTGYPVTGHYIAIGFIKDSKIVAQAIFNDYTNSDIEIHLNAPKCISKKNIKEVYNYVFNYLKCNRLTAKPYSTNEYLLQLLPRLGFEYEFTQESHYGTRDNPIDAKVYKLTKENASRWIKINA